MNTKLLFTTLTLLALLSGCAHTTVEKDKLSSVRKVAIVGFDVQQQKAVGLGDLIGIAAKVKSENKADVAMGQDSAHLISIYNDLRTQIEKETSWKVLTLEQLANNPIYTALYKEKTDGFQFRPQINNKYELLQAPKVLDTFALRTTKEESLEALEKALGVDALLIVKVNVNIYKGGFIYAMKSLFGQAELEPQASTNLTLMQARTKSTLWNEASAQGEAVKSNEKTFLGLAEDQVVQRLSVQAAQSSFVTLFKQYNETMTK